MHSDTGREDLSLQEENTIPYRELIGIHVGRNTGDVARAVDAELTDEKFDDAQSDEDILFTKRSANGQWRGNALITNYPAIEPARVHFHLHVARLQFLPWSLLPEQAVDSI